MFYCRFFTYSIYLFYFFLFQRKSSEMHRLTGVKFCTLISTRQNFIMPVQNFGLPPKKIVGAKNMQNLTQFLTTSNFDGKYL